ncbi:MAG: glycogen debranching protein GlgX [Anaerolineae bacterium]|nr:glycogen debranching protein GlgX [Anaerolineae bacterium]
MPLKSLPGRSFPLGATVIDGGVNFCVFSKNCYSVELLLFDEVDTPQPHHRIILDPKRNRTFYYWHIFIPGIRQGQLYGYRVKGPYAPHKGHRFDGTKVLLDPYTRGVAVGRDYIRAAAIGPGDNCAHAMKSVVVDADAYDWEGDHYPQIPYAKTVIYEMHVGGFTRHPSSGVALAQRGTYAGLVEKIPYLKSLNITAVELLPIQQFDEQDAPPSLSNYWGYSSIAFFAPHSGYCSDRDPLGPVNEFRDMVKALHRTGIEVILDVVFNHTAEGGQSGPTLCFRGLENRAYYILQQDRTQYANYSGCGNTFNTNQSIVRRMILDCLRYWVAEMHVDGFRFDLASVMARDEWGQPLKSPPILWEIESDPVLAGTKIIAEAWDAAGLYQVGSFIGHRWAEWNGQFRDDVRRFIKGDNGTVRQMANRIPGSPDLYHQKDREPNRSINFITCHDGFTLNDLVSYNIKHNLANGEQNHDGMDANYSWNCGIEGPSNNPTIEELRLRQIKNAITILLISQGTPMILMGDEVRRTQGGNNNGYCQDNALSWFNWNAVQEQGALLRFVRGVIKFTQTLAVFREEYFWAMTFPDGTSSPRSYIEKTENETVPQVTWHGTQLNHLDLEDYSHSLAFELSYPLYHEHLYVILNAYWEPLNFELPPLTTPNHWYRIIDTARSTPQDFRKLDTAPLVTGTHYHATSHSTIVLQAYPVRPPKEAKL